MRSKRSKRKPSYNTKKVERKSKGSAKRSLPGINKEKLAEMLLPGELKVPAPIMEKSTRFFIIGGSIGVAGIVFSLVMRSFTGVLIAIFLGLSLASYGYIPILKVSKTGYICIEGVCERLEDNGMVKNTITPPRFIIRRGWDEDDNDDDAAAEFYAIPYYKQNAFIPDGSRVRIYYPKDAFFYKSRGALTSASMIGYEVM